MASYLTATNSHASCYVRLYRSYLFRFPYVHSFDIVRLLFAMASAKIRFSEFCVHLVAVHGKVVNSNVGGLPGRFVIQTFSYKFHYYNIVSNISVKSKIIAKLLQSLLCYLYRQFLRKTLALFYLFFDLSLRGKNTPRANKRINIYFKCKSFFR